MVESQDIFPELSEVVVGGSVAPVLPFTEPIPLVSYDFVEKSLIFVEAMIRSSEFDSSNSGCVKNIRDSKSQNNRQGGKRKSQIILQQSWIF